MSEDIRVMTAQLAADPSSLVFLPLGEALRQRRQLEAAERVVVAGLTRYPDLADAHDLYARILGDQGDFERAFDEWGIALANDPDHSGSHKGIGYLYFVAGDLDKALEHLRRAATLNPGDDGITAAIARVDEALAVRGPAAKPELPRPEPMTPDQPVEVESRAEPSGPVVEPEAADSSAAMELLGDTAVLVDRQGRLLSGSLGGPGGEQLGDTVAAHLAGVGAEAARAARILNLGVWQGITVQGGDACLHLTAPSAETVLMLVREPDMPLGRLAVQADRAAAAARRWLESLE